MNISTKDKQNQIIYLLYKFRFLTVFHFQKLISHKDPRRINNWLKNLLDKKYISRQKLKDSSTMPYVYHLSQSARHFLKDGKNYNTRILNRLYKEKNLTKNFIIHTLSLADVYIFFLVHKQKDTELNFFTKNELQNYDYFPRKLPDAYIAVVEAKATTRYFLDLFDEPTPLWAIRKKVRDYFQYYEINAWHDHTDNSQFPTILLILPNSRVQKHIYYFTKAILEKNFFEDISIFLTSKEKMKANEQDIWEKIEVKWS